MAWPRKAEISIGDYAEDWGVNKKMDYQVIADGELMNRGSIGTWILGKHYLNVPLENKKELAFIIKTDRRQGIKKTLMLADAYLITDKGHKIALSTLNAVTKNVATLPVNGKDYEKGPVKISGVSYKESIGVEPDNAEKEALLSYNLQGLNVVRLEGVIGGDYPVGNEEQLRKTVGVRLRGNEATYVTVLEPHEGKVEVDNPSEIKVELVDGRVQNFELQGFYSIGKEVIVSMVERKDRMVIRSESTTKN